MTVISRGSRKTTDTRGLKPFLCQPPFPSENHSEITLFNLTVVVSESRCLRADFMGLGYTMIIFRTPKRKKKKTLMLGLLLSRALVCSLGILRLPWNSREGNCWCRSNSSGVQDVCRGRPEHVLWFL